MKKRTLLIPVVVAVITLGAFACVKTNSVPESAAHATSVDKAGKDSAPCPPTCTGKAIAK